MALIKRFYEKDNKAQDRDTVLFVEGPDDATFLEELLTLLKANPSKVGILTVGGNANFGTELNEFITLNPAVTQRRVKRIAVVCDADDNPGQIELLINNSLNPISGGYIASGTWIAGVSGIQVGLFIFPAPGIPGDLDKLCLDTVVGTSVEIAAENFINAAEGLATKNGVKLSGSRYKRKVQAFLAGSPGELSRGAGRGFRNGLFNASHIALDPLRGFLAMTLE